MERTLAYLKDLREDMKHVIESEESSIQVDSNDLRHVNEAIEDIAVLQKQIEYREDQEILYKISVSKEAKKVKHLFPLENTAGYGQLCDMLLAYEQTLAEIERVLKVYGRANGDIHYIECVERVKNRHLVETEN
ncbi:hypothetical protein [Psychrobacillus sp. FSL K6-1464]|uniref:hypothetical protein n=1 Tax=Psychrobacillus sp. FSL K6-1464 TaxID=2921545 RepID=UPI0030FA0827